MPADNRFVGWRWGLAHGAVRWGMALVLGFPIARGAEMKISDTGPSGATVSGQAEAYQVQVIPSIDIRQNGYHKWSIVYNTETFPAGRSNGLLQGFSLTENGQAFGNEPARGAFEGQQDIGAFEGARLVNTKRRNLGTFMGELVSDPFEVKGDRIDFLIGGGNNKLPVRLELLVAGKVVLKTSGDNTHTLARKSWDVSAFKGRKDAQLRIIDYASINTFGQPSWPEDEYGYIMVDDIRQTDAAGKRVAAEEDAANNFGFETVDLKVDVVPGAGRDSDQEFLQEFQVRSAGRAVGTIRYAMKKTAVTPERTTLDHEWRYQGERIEGIKLILKTRIPIGAEKANFYCVPGLIYNGNKIGCKAHYLDEDLPEDASTLCGGFSVEDGERVFGGWMQPQEDGDDPMTSIRLRKNLAKDAWEAVQSVPYSAQFGRFFNQDEDFRLTLKDGDTVSKRSYLYTGAKKTFAHIDNTKTGFGQVLSDGWKTLYPDSPTNPAQAMDGNYQMKLATLLSNKGIKNTVTHNGKTYTIWWVARWLMGDDFDFEKSKYVPLDYFHRYTGFSWSGMIGTSAFHSFKKHFRDGDKAAYEVAEGTMDFFAENGMSPIGMLYPTYYPGRFGSYAGAGEVDMGYMGEALLAYLRCYALLKEHNIDKPLWLKVVKSSLDSVMKRYPDGDVPGRINGTTGALARRHAGCIYWNRYKDLKVNRRSGSVRYTRPSEGGPTSFSLLVWPLVSYYQLTGEKAYLDYAEKIGDVQLQVFRDYGVVGGMEADFFNVDKRMGHTALAAFNDLHEATGKPKWLEASEIAANWFGSFVYAYNVSFDNVRGTPMQAFDTRTVGGTPVDIKASTNNSAFEQGATEYIKLWYLTGNMEWFERARAILHNGNGHSLTEEKRKWINENWQGPAIPPANRWNPKHSFDRHCLGGGTEDAICSWAWKGMWTTKNTGILAGAMLALGLDWDDIKEEFGGITYSMKWNNGGCLDTLDQFQIRRDGNTLRIQCRNMIPAAHEYVFKLKHFEGDGIELNGEGYTKEQIARGIPVRFGPNETKSLTVEFQ